MNKVIVKLPNLKGDNWSDRFLSLYDGLGWNRQDSLDPTKIILNNTDWGNIVDDLRSYAKNQDEMIGISMAWVNKGASADKEVERGTVELQEGWIG